MMDSNAITVKLNEFQSTPDELELFSYPTEVQEQFYEFINTVPFIKYLIGERPRAKDLERDEKGRIKIDITRPHILEDMDYFRPAARFFQQNGCYTFLRPNPNPNSEYGKWIYEEIRRCREGYVRESDGEWIPGSLYFFLNYCPIPQTKTVKGSKRGARIIDFPEFWEGIYWRMHYIEQAREQGKHGCEISSRGKSKSLSMAAIMAKLFVLGESDEICQRVKCMATAYQKQYLTSDGILNKFEAYIDFLAQNTQWPSKRLKSSMADMVWTMGYRDLDTGTAKGTLNEVYGVSAKDDPSKVRGKRLHFIVIEEFGSFKNVLELYNIMLPSVQEGEFSFGQMYLIGCCCAGTKVWTPDGRYINIEDLKKEDGIVGYAKYGFTKDSIGTYAKGITVEPIGQVIRKGLKPCYRITTSNGNSIECSEDHPILIQKLFNPRNKKDPSKRMRSFYEVFKEAKYLKIGDRVCEAREINIFGGDTLFDARLVGMLVGDGSYGFDNTPKYSSEDKELLDYIKDSYDWGLSHSHVSKRGKLYEEIRVKGICSNLREIGIYGQTKTNKRLPDNYQKLAYEDTVLLLSGIVDTDGCVFFNKLNSSVSITQSHRGILEEIQILLRKIGVISSIHKTEPKIKSGRKDKNPWFTLTCAGRFNIEYLYKHLKLLVPHKIQALEKAYNWYQDNPSKKPQNFSKDLIINKIISIEYLGEKEVYNLSSCVSHTYLANNIITHNTAGDDESDFSGAAEIVYNPDGYRMLALNNVFDIEGRGRPKITFFFPGYINRKGCYDLNGNSDVTKAILEILADRFRIKYNSSDINSITKAIAEIPITPQEAILRTQGNIFPVAPLTERLNQLDANPNEYNDVLTGTVIIEKNGEAKFIPTSETPIREFPIKKDNSIKGAVEIFQMPEKNPQGQPYADRYIIGVDPVDHDVADSVSLTSTIVLDLFTDRIVAEYTGRKDYADENFEIARALSLLYNAKIMYEQNKKGLFAYFSMHNCTHLLADTPEYLKDKQLIKFTGYGNSAKGVNATLPINKYADDLIRSWLLKPVTTTVKDGEEEKETTVSNLFFIRNRALLKELILCNPDINVDRVRALGMVMLYREEKMILYQGNVASRDSRPMGSGLAHDPFFEANYDCR
jgi:intein/homing endonuclease